MKENSKIRKEIVSYIRDLPAEKVKTVVIEWLNTEEGNIADLKQNLALETEKSESVSMYDATDINLNFIPLTEEEMIAQSLNVLDRYNVDKHGVSQEKMEQLADSLVA